MPRIRTIKPEFCTSEQVAECSTTARLLFVTMWCFCDDAGRHPASVRRLKMECFPGDDFSLEDMQAYVNELHAAKLLIEFEYEGERFWQVTGWKHQKIDKPNIKYGPRSDAKTVLPVESCMVIGNPRFGDDSPTVPRPPDEHSEIARLRKGEESTGKESKGREGSGIDDQSTTPVETPKVDKRTAVQRKPPTIEEVQTYMRERGYPDQAEEFVDFYSANGWVQGRGKPIRDWQAAVRNWQRNDFGRNPNSGKPTVEFQVGGRHPRDVDLSL